MSHVVNGFGNNGEVIGQVSVACQTGAVALTNLQRPGKGAMKAEVFIQGYSLPIGKIL